MDHQTFLATLPADRKASLTQRNNRAGVIRLAAHLTLIAATAIWIWAAIPFWQLILPVQGVLIVFLFTLEHETTHQTPFASRRLNEVVGHITGAILIVPFLWFRYFHLAHHRHTHDPDKDPELSGKAPTTIGGYAWHISGLPYWAAMIRALLGNAFGKTGQDYIPERAKQKVRREARLHVALYALAAISLTQSTALFWLWILPMLLGQPFLRLYLMAEHGRCPHVSDMLENTRTTFTTRAVRFLAWNMPYHAEHHTLPAVPFHQLPELHKDLADHLKSTANGYIAFHRDHIHSLQQDPCVPQNRA